MNKKLFASHWIGEFGWELMAWQGHLRYWSQNGYDVTVGCLKRQEFLYKDFAKDIHTLKADGGIPDCFMRNGIRNLDEFEKVLYRYNRNGYNIILPQNIGCFPNSKGITVNDNFKKQSFIQYTSDTPTKEYDIILHSRARSLDPSRNWGTEKYELLIEKLLNDGYSIASIGSLKDANEFSGVDSYNGKSLDFTVSLLNNCKLAIGESSGAMHLASLCGTKHLVWSYPPNKERYETVWNPLNTPVIFYSDEDWNPKVDSIYNLITKYINI